MEHNEMDGEPDSPHSIHRIRSHERMVVHAAVRAAFWRA